MKKLSSFFLVSTIALSVLLVAAVPQQRVFSGAWNAVNGAGEYSMIAADNYVMVTHFDKTNRKFISTFGGKVKQLGKKLSVTIEFNTADKTQVGKTVDYVWDAKTVSVTSNISGNTATWRLVDQGTENLTGNWRFLQRKDGEKFSEVTPLRARRTYKLLTASRFQWAAVNVETGEFFGTGGGNYTFKDGKYTENIEFFSRDSSRVGASLTFDAELKDGNWHHSGLSSRGDPMYEVWGRIR